jgi:hypothetical protein
VSKLPNHTENNGTPHKPNHNSPLAKRQPGRHDCGLGLVWLNSHVVTKANKNKTTEKQI